MYHHRVISLAEEQIWLLSLAVLSHNKVKKISVVSLVGLTKLSLSHNKLKEVPDLKVLYVLVSELAVSGLNTAANRVATTTNIMIVALATKTSVAVTNLWLDFILTSSPHEWIFPQFWALPTLGKGSPACHFCIWLSDLKIITSEPSHTCLQNLVEQQAVTIL